MADITQAYIEEWNKRNPNDPFANLVKAEVYKVAGQNYVKLYLPIYVGGVLHQEELMKRLSAGGYSFISVENALKNFFDRFPKFSEFDFVYHKVNPNGAYGYMVPPNNTAITFEEVLRSADEKGFQIPRNYILVDKKPDILPNTPPPTTNTTKSNKIGIGWILLGIAVGGIVLYKIAKK